MAGVEALEYKGKPESIRDAKGRLREHHGYKQTQHQSQYASQINWELAMQNSRSFKRFHHAVEELSRTILAQQWVITPKL